MNSFRKKFILAVISMLGLSTTSLFTVSEGKLSVGQILDMASSKKIVGTKGKEKGKKYQDDETDNIGKGKGKEDKENEEGEAEEGEVGDGEDGEVEEVEEDEVAAGTKGKVDATKQLRTPGSKKETAAYLQNASNRGDVAAYATAGPNTNLLASANRYDSYNPAADYSLEGLSDQGNETQQSPLVKLQTDMVTILNSLDAFWPKTGTKNARGYENRGPNSSIQTLGDLRRLVNLDSLSRVLPPKQMATINDILSNKDEATGQELPLNTKQVIDKAVNVARVLSIYYKALGERVEELKKSEAATNGGLTDQQRAAALNALAGNMQNVFRKFNTQSDLETLSSIFTLGVSPKMRKERLGEFLQRKGFSKEEISSYTSDDGIATFKEAATRYFDQLERLKETQTAGPNGSKTPQPFMGGPQMNNFDPVKAERVHVMSIIASELNYGLDPDAYKTYIASKYNELSEALLLGLSEIPVSGANGVYAYRLRAIFDDKVDSNKLSNRLDDAFVKKCVESLKKSPAFDKFINILSDITKSSSAGYQNYFESKYTVLDEARMDAVNRVNELANLYNKVKSEFDDKFKPGSIFAGRFFYKSDAFKKLFEKNAADSSAPGTTNLKAIGLDTTGNDAYGAFIKTFMGALEKEKIYIADLTNTLQPVGETSEEYYAKLSYSDNKNRIDAFIKVVDVVYPILRFLFSPINAVVENEQIAIDAGVPRGSLKFLRNLESYDDNVSVATILGTVLGLQMNLVRYINMVGNVAAFNDSVGKNAGGTLDKKPFVKGTLTVHNNSGEDTLVAKKFNDVTGLMTPTVGSTYSADTAVWSTATLQRFLFGVFTLSDLFGENFGSKLKEISGLDGGSFVTIADGGATLDPDVVMDANTSKFVKIGKKADYGVESAAFYTADNYKKIKEVDKLIDYFLGDGDVTKGFDALGLNAGDNSSNEKMNFRDNTSVLRQRMSPDIMWLFDITRGVQRKLNSFNDRLHATKMGLIDSTEFTTRNKKGDGQNTITLKQAGAFLVAGDDNYVPIRDNYMPKKEVATSPETKVSKLDDELRNLSATDRAALFKSWGLKEINSTPTTVGSTTPNFYYNGGYGYGSSPFTNALSERRPGLFAY